jgi:GMP synthase-like glutamine amidotransferase
MNAIALVNLSGDQPPLIDTLTAPLAAQGWEVQAYDGKRGQLPRGHDPILLVGSVGDPDERSIARGRLLAALKLWADKRSVLAVGLGFPILAKALGWGVRPLDHHRRGWFPVAQTADGLADPTLSQVPQGAAGHEDRDWAVLPPSAATASADKVLSFSSIGDVAAARFGARAMGLVFHPGVATDRPADAVTTEIIARFFTNSAATNP